MFFQPGLQLYNLRVNEVTQHRRLVLVLVKLPLLEKFSYFNNFHFQTVNYFIRLLLGGGFLLSSFQLRL